MQLRKRQLAAYSAPALPIAVSELLVVMLLYRYPLDEKMHNDLQSRLAAQQS